MQTQIWLVPNMVSEADVKAVRTAVNSLNGVDLLAADPSSRLITVAYDPTKADPGEIAAYLATSGYPVNLPPM
jgi:copper chaperone CopZ